MSGRGLGPDPGQHGLHLRQNAGDDLGDAFAGRMQAVADMELGIAHDAVQKEWVEDEIVRRGKLRIDRVERPPVVRSRDSARPASRTAAPRYGGPSDGGRFPSSASRVTFGSMPRSMSLAPSSRITASVPSGTDQSSRARPPELVSPETPALATSTASPLALSARSSCTGKAALAVELIAGGQRIAERHHLDGPFGRARRAQHPRSGHNAIASAAASRWTLWPSFPYERGADSRAGADIRST